MLKLITTERKVKCYNETFFIPFYFKKETLIFGFFFKIFSVLAFENVFRFGY